VALVEHPGSAVELLALGLLGLAATLGILLYELRNSPAASRRAVVLAKQAAELLDDRVRWHQKPTASESDHPIEGQQKLRRER
jgi:hypothetical protein